MLKKIRSYFLIFLGLTLTAIATGIFYLPNEIVTGGVSGIATILYTFGIPPGLVYFSVNLILLSVSYKVLGRAFVANSVIAVIYVSIAVQFFSGFEPLTHDILLNTIFGSVLFGLGAVLTFMENANTGGTDIIARLIQAGFSYFPIGKLLLIIDTIIILASLVIFKNFELALYGIIGLFISTVVIDFLIDSLNSSKLAFVITERGEAVSETIIANSRRGVTILNARGAYSNERKKLLICALKSHEIPNFHKLIRDTDKNAFIIFTKSEKIFGLGFYVYK